jgi:hypothetical protein
MRTRLLTCFVVMSMLLAALAPIAQAGVRIRPG